MPILNKNLLIILYENQNGNCAYCGCSLLEEARAGRNPQFDHIKPKSKGGKDDMENLNLSCNWCNIVKKDRSMKEFLEYIRPYLEGKVPREELSDFKKYNVLKKKFNGID